MKGIQAYQCDFCDMHHKDFIVIKKHEENKHPKEVSKRDEEEKLTDELQLRMLDIYGEEDDEWTCETDDSGLDTHAADFEYDRNILRIEDLQEFTVTEMASGNIIYKHKRKTKKDA